MNNSFTDAEFLEEFRQSILLQEERGLDGDREGWFNRFFKNYPTSEELDEWIIRHLVVPKKKSLAKRKDIENKIMKESDPSLIKSRIITINFDKSNYKELRTEEAFTNAFCDIYVNEFKKSNYKFITNGKMCFEFYGKTGTFNPHIHIYTEDDTPIGAIAQVLRRKFVEKSKWKIWTIDVAHGNASHQEEYLDEMKLPSGNEILTMKQINKLKDKDLRNKLNIPHSYDL